MEELKKLAEEPGDSPPGPPEEIEALRADLRDLGVFGLLVALSDAPPPDPALAAELPAKLVERLRAQLAADAAREGTAAPSEGLAVADVLALYRDKKGAQILRKAIENTIYEFYDLREHALFVDDVGRVLDLFRASRGPTDDIKMFVKRLAALSSETAKFMLGLFPEQISLIYKVARREAERAEIDEALEGFGPRAIWKRIFAILKALLQHEKRLRLALTLWGRMQGTEITREHMAGLDKYLAVKDNKALVLRAIERKEARAALVAARKARAADLAALEGAF